MRCFNTRPAALDAALVGSPAVYDGPVIEQELINVRRDVVSVLSNVSMLGCTNARWNASQRRAGAELAY